MASPSAEAIDESTHSFLLADNLARVKEEEKEEEEEAELARREQKLLEELERHVLRSSVGGRAVCAVPGSLAAALARRGHRCCLGWGQDRGVEEGKEEKEEEEEEEKDEEGTFPLLLFLTSSTFLSSHSSSVSGCCLKSPRLLDFWDMTSMMFSYSTLSLVLGYTLMRQST